jgi:hypothetical protein
MSTAQRILSNGSDQATWLRGVRRAVLAGLVVWIALTSSLSELLGGEGKAHGVVKYEKVPYRDKKTGAMGLQRDHPEAVAVVSAKVELVAQADNKVLGTTITGADGAYSIPWKVNGRVNAIVRVWAKVDNAQVHNYFDHTRLKKETTFSTASEPFAIDQEDAKQDVLALEKTNEAGPFNILAAVHRANNFLREAEPGLKFPRITIYWAPESSPPCTTCFSAEEKAAFVRGMRDIDADEFDDSVLIHEYGHFVMKVFSRDDSPGGTHGGNEKIDARLAWSEGWANFFASAVLGDPIYVDTGGKAGKGVQATFSLDEPRPKGDPSGYWSEHTVGSTLWHFLAKAPRGKADPDDVHLGIPFKDLWSVVRGPWAKHPHGTLIDFCDMLVASKPELGPRVAKVLAAHNMTYAPGKAPTVAGYLYLRPLSLGVVQSGLVDSFKHKYEAFGGAALYQFTLDKKAKVKAVLELVKSDQPAASRLDLLLFGQDGQIDRTFVNVSGKLDYLPAELGPGNYIVEVRSYGVGFNSGSYNLSLQTFAGLTPLDVERFIKEGMKTTAHKHDPENGVATYETPNGYFDVLYDRGKTAITFRYEYGMIKASKAKIDLWNGLADQSSRATLSSTGAVTLSGTIGFDVQAPKLQEFHDRLKKEKDDFEKFVKAPG